MTSLTDDHSAPSGRPRIRLAPIRHHHTVFDGCWVPRSSDLQVELPVLLAGLDDRAGSPVVRLRLSAAGWTKRPPGIVVPGGTVSLGYFSDQPRTTATAIRADGGVVTLLVVPALVTQPGEDDGGPVAAAWSGSSPGAVASTT